MRSIAFHVVLTLVPLCCAKEQENDFELQTFIGNLVSTLVERLAGNHYVLKVSTLHHAETSVAHVNESGTNNSVASNAIANCTANVDCDVEWKFNLLRSVGEECLSDERLRSLLSKKPDFVLYDGFEPSGRMHIAQGIFKSVNVNRCTKAGGTFIFWIADWFAFMNDKMGGDLAKIRTVGLYLMEVWKASGMNMSRVKFLWSSDEINRNAEAYWTQALDIARRFTLVRMSRCCTIMGRNNGTLSAAQLLYPIMQCTDIFFLKADICQLGVDQRKVNLLAWDWCQVSGRKIRPIILSHHMLYGLKAGQAKMSKSDPESAIFMEDAAEDVERKIRKAFCPSSVEESLGATQAVGADEEMHLLQDELKNPCLDYVQHILFSNEGMQFGAGGTTYTNFEDVKQAFLSGVMSEDDLKTGIITEVNRLLEPVRQHFKTDSNAKRLLETVHQFKKDAAPAPSILKRLQAFQNNETPTFAVFAPLPADVVSAELVFDVLSRLHEAIRHAPSICDIVLWLEDWSAFVLNQLEGSREAIQGFYDILIHSLHVLGGNIMKHVRVVFQSKTILKDPSNYWISVITVGRRYKLSELHTVLPARESLEHAGQVVAALMHVADALSLSSNAGLTLYYGREKENMHRLVSQHFEFCGLEQPALRLIINPPLRLLPNELSLFSAEDAAHVYLADSESLTNGKMKKAFCAPQNCSFCPPLDWASILLSCGGELLLKRTPDNGGDKSYTERQDLVQDYATGALHPGDLKTNVARWLNEALKDVRMGLKAADLVKALKRLDKIKKTKAKKKPIEALHAHGV